MDRGWRHLAGGASLLVGSLVFLVLGTLTAHSQPVVELVLLLLPPSVGALAGAIVLLTGLAKRPITEGRSQVFGRIVGLGTLAGVGLGLGLLVVGIVLAIPDWAAGFTGMLGVGFGVGVSALFSMGGGLVGGFAVGLIIALSWWVARGRQLPA